MSNVPKEAARYSPNGLSGVTSCALNYFGAEEGENAAKQTGTVRHKGCELWALDERKSMTDAALEAAQAFPEYPEEVRVAGIVQLRQVDTSRMPDRRLAISIEGSDLPDALRGEAYGQPVLEFVARDENGPWGYGYALRMRLDIVTLEGSVLRSTDYKGADPTWDGPNDVMAAVQFLGLCKLREALNLQQVDTIAVDALGIPSMIRDRFEWRVDQYDAVLAQVDQYVWYYRQQMNLLKGEQEPRPGPKCKRCPMAVRCPAVEAAALALVQPAEERQALIETLEDLEVLDLLEKWGPQADAINGAVSQLKAEVIRRSRSRGEEDGRGKAIINEGFEFYAAEEGTSSIRWDFDATVDYFKTRLGFNEARMREHLRIDAKKGEVEKMVKALVPGRTRNAIEQREAELDRFRKLYTQGKTWKLKKKAIKDQKALPVNREEPKQIEGGDDADQQG